MRNNLQSLLTLCWLWIVLQERAWECLPGEREKECLRWPSPILRQNFCQFWKKHQRCHLYQAVLKMFTLFRKFLHSSTLCRWYIWYKGAFDGKFCYDEKMWLTELFCQEKKISLMALFVKKRKYHWVHFLSCKENIIDGTFCQEKEISLSALFIM